MGWEALSLDEIEKESVFVGFFRVIDAGLLFLELKILNCQQIWYGISSYSRIEAILMLLGQRLEF